MGLRNWGDNLGHAPCAAGVNVFAPRETKGIHGSFGFKLKEKASGSRHGAGSWQELIWRGFSWIRSLSHPRAEEHSPVCASPRWSEFQAPLPAGILCPFHCGDSPTELQGFYWIYWHLLFNPSLDSLGEKHQEFCRTELEMPVPNPHPESSPGSWKGWAGANGSDSNSFLWIPVGFK